MTKPTVILNKRNGETFSPHTFMGVTIWVRDSDGYVNATKMGKGDDKIRQFVNGDKFTEICHHWSLRSKDTDLVPKYVLGAGFNKELAGTYVHQDLVHFVAEWVDIDYAFIVQKIMNDLDRQLHQVLKDHNLPDEPELVGEMIENMQVDLKVKEETIKNLEQKLQYLNDEVTKVNGVLNRKDDIIDELEKVKKKIGKELNSSNSKVRRLKDRVYNEGVRTNINMKPLRLILTDDGTYEVSAEERIRRGGEIVQTFWFPATMNIRQDIKAHFNKYGNHLPIFTAEEYPALIAYIMEKDPKINE